MTPEQEQEFRDEAQRLTKVPIAEQRQIIALHWSVAEDKEVSAENRKEARARAKALEKYLRLRPRKKTR